MAASKPEILLSQLPDEIETKFQRLNLLFRACGKTNMVASKPEKPVRPISAFPMR